MAGADKEEHQRRDQEGSKGDVVETTADTAELIDDSRSLCNSPNCDGPHCDGCGGSGCGCDLLLFVRLSTLLLAVAAVLPEIGTGRTVRALIRGYQRGLSRFTPICPSTPSCSAYALLAVETLGPRRGLAAAARRIGGCR